jgi:hypothetical protein
MKLLVEKAYAKKLHLTKSIIMKPTIEKVNVAIN